MHHKVLWLVTTLAALLLASVARAQDCAPGGRSEKETSQVSLETWRDATVPDGNTAVGGSGNVTSAADGSELQCKAELSGTGGSGSVGDGSTLERRTVKQDRTGSVMQDTSKVSQERTKY